MSKEDQEFDRLMRLLDGALNQVKKGDSHSAMMCMEEAVKSAERLPKKSTQINEGEEDEYKKTR